MTQRFILDENVVMYAQRGENESGAADPTCSKLVSDIIRICHTLVFDFPLWSKYQSQLSGSSAETPQLGIGVLRALNQAIRREGKIEFRPEVSPSFSEETAIPPGSRSDVEMVRLVIESGATQVTTDKPLPEDLNSCGVTETYGLDILTPAKALKAL